MSVFNPLWPSVCIHCHETLQKHPPIFCGACQDQLEFFDPKERLLTASCLELIGPAITFDQLLEKNISNDHAKTAAALMVFQIHRLKWPLPDFVMPCSIGAANAIAKQLCNYFGLKKPPGKNALLISLRDEQDFERESQVALLREKGFSKVYFMSLFHTAFSECLFH